MTYEHFWTDWMEAVDKFKVIQHRVVGMPEQMTHYIHAEADTGSKYELLGQEVQIDWRNQHGHTFMVTVMNPWVACWQLQQGALTYPDYAIERWGSPRGKDMHGGDVAALVICLGVIGGSTIEDSLEFARKMAAGAVARGA
jgi:hypothetical protein